MKRRTNEIIGLSMSASLLLTGCTGGVEDSAPEVQQSTIGQNDFVPVPSTTEHANTVEMAENRVLSFLESQEEFIEQRTLIQPQDGFELAYNYLQTPISYEQYFDLAEDIATTDCGLTDSLIVFKIANEDDSDVQYAALSAVSNDSMHLVYGNAQALLDSILTDSGQGSFNQLSINRKIDLPLLVQIAATDFINFPTPSGCEVIGQLVFPAVITDNPQPDNIFPTPEPPTQTI